MASTLPVTERPVPSIVEHRVLRFALIFLLYMAQGLPVGLFMFAFPAWIAANGASALQVGALVSAATLPWSLKFVNGFIMDRYAWLPMGRRRPWLIISQGVLVIAFVSLAIANPGPTDLWVLSAFAFAANVATTFQDVAIDGMAVDLVPNEERARINGFMFGGQSIGIAGGTAITGIVIELYGMPEAVFGLAVFIGILIVALLVFRERPGERLLPWSEGEASAVNLERHAGAWGPILKTTLKEMLRGNSLRLIGGLFAYGSIYGIYLGAMPLVATGPGGWSDAEFSSLSGTGNLIAGLLSVLIFGYIADMITPRRSAMVGATFMLLLAVSFIFVERYWSDQALIVTFVISFLSAYLLTQISMCSLAMHRSNVAVAATQFTLYMAIANIGISAGAAVLGILDALGGLKAMYIVAALAALMTIIIVKTYPIPAREE